LSPALFCYHVLLEALSGVHTMVAATDCDRLCYDGANVLAPMVRLGTLPLRMLAAEYGADLTYTEELIDKRLLACSRLENQALGTTDFVDKKGGLVFRTTPLERRRVVLQLGTADAVTAVEAARLVAPYVAAVDVNMGCPVHFSTSGGMGSALLQKPETVASILRALVAELPCPVSCKIRLLPTRAETVAFAQMAERCGIAAMGVHGRYVSQRPRDAAHWDEIAAVCAAVRLPVIANGDVFCYDDFERLRCATGASAAMCARGAQWNASIFRAQGPLPAREVRRAYAAACLRWGNPLGNSKHCLREMLIADIGLASPEGRVLHAAQSDAALAALYKTEELAGLGEEEGEREAKRACKGNGDAAPG